MNLLKNLLKTLVRVTNHQVIGGLIVAAVGAAVATWWHATKPPIPPEAVLGVWQMDIPSHVDVPGRPGLDLNVYGQLTLNADGQLLLNGAAVASETAQSTRWEVTCTGLARGRWELSGKTLSGKLNEDLKADVVSGARADRRVLDGAQAQSENFSCPPYIVLPSGFWEVAEILQISSDRLVTKTTSMGDTGSGGQVVYTRRK